MADFANVDQGGKANVIGAGIRIIGRDDGTGVTAPFALVIRVEADGPHDEDLDLEVRLTDASGVLTELKPAENVVGLRNVVIHQPVPLRLTEREGFAMPHDALAPSAQTVLTFPNGLPLKTGGSYQWVVSAGGRDPVRHTFYVVPNPTQ